MSDLAGVLALVDEPDVGSLAARVAELALERLPPADRAVAQRCVAPHWFDAALIFKLARELDADDPSATCDRIVALPFVERLPDERLVYHETTRRGLLRHLAQEAPEVLRDGAARAARLLRAYDDAAAFAERVHCLRVAGEREQARELQDELFERAVAASDWQLYDALARREVATEEELAFVEPLFARSSAIVCGRADEPTAQRLVELGIVDGPPVPASDSRALAAWIAETRKTVLLLSPATAPEERAALDAALARLTGPETIARRVVPLVEGEPLRPQCASDLAEIALAGGREAWLDQLLVALGREPATPAVPEPDVPAGWRVAHPPPSTGEFVGRERELAELDDWLATPETSTVVLRGLGGAGKSSLAWRWLTAARERGAAPREAIWWSFYEGDTDFGVFQAYALTALGVRVEQVPAVEQVAAVLSERDLLVVLDGLERVEGGADRADELLRLAADGRLGGARLLVTTRHAPDAVLAVDESRAPGVRLIDVGPLAEADALALLRRAGVRGDVRRLTELVGRYAGHALSLRLVAGLVRDDRQRPGDPAVERRLDVHGTLVQRRSHVVEHAYEALTQDERLLLASIALIEGAFSREEAACAAGAELDSPELADWMATLGRRGLLDATSATGCLELHPVVRAYAQSRLSTTQRTAVDRRLAEAYRARVRADPHDEQARARLVHRLLALRDIDGLAELTAEAVVSQLRDQGLDEPALAAAGDAARAVMDQLVEGSDAGARLAAFPEVHAILAGMMPQLIAGLAPPPVERVAGSLIAAQPREQRDSRELEVLAADLVDAAADVARAHAPNARAAEARDAVDEVAREARVLRAALRPTSSTPGTRRDYLSWLVERYAIDPMTGAAVDDVAVPLAVAREDDTAGEHRELELVLRAERRILLVGGAGAGKSFMLRRLARAQAEPALRDGSEQSPLPLLVPLLRYETGPLEPLLVEAPLREGCDVSGLRDLVQRAVLRNEALVLLDGLDELSPDRQAELADAVLEFVARYPHIHVVIATRPLAAARRALAGGFASYEIARPTADVAQRLVERFARQAGGEGSVPWAVEGAFWMRAPSPLLLALIGQFHAQSGELPASPVELYAELVRVIDEARPPTGLLDASVVRRRVLSSVAYALTAIGSSTLDESQLREIVRQEAITQWASASRFDPLIKSSTDALLAELRQGDALFGEIAPDRYGFTMRGLQEYFAALHIIARRRDVRRELRRHLHHPAWNEVLTLALARIGLDDATDAAELLSSVVLAAGKSAQGPGFGPSAHEHVLGRDLLFATECVARGVRVTPAAAMSLGAAAAEQLLDRQGAGRFPTQRRLLFEAVGTTADSFLRIGFALVPLEALDSASGERRVAAIECLARLGSASSELDSRLHDLLRDRDAGVRIAAAAALLGLAEDVPRDALTVLRREMRSADPRARRIALAALTRLSPLPAAIEDDLPALLHDADPDMRTAAVSLARRVRRPRRALLARLFACGCETDHALLRAAVADAFAGYSERAGTIAFVDDRVRTGRTDERCYAAGLLARLGEGSDIARDALHGLLGQPATRRAAVAALGQLGDASPALLDAAAALLGESDPEARRTGIAAVAELFERAVEVPQSAVEPASATGSELERLLERGLGDPDPVVGLRSANAILRRARHPAAAERLDALLRNGPLAVRLDAAAALVHLEGRLDGTGEVVDEGLRDGDAQVRAMAIVLGGRVWRPEEARIERLACVMREDPDAAPRVAAAIAIGQLARRPSLWPVAEQTLSELLEQSREGPRSDAAIAADPQALAAETVADVAWSVLHGLATWSGGSG